MNQAPERLDRFMGRANALYYASHDPFADFVTAPEICQSFGEVLGLWVLAAWERQGRPQPLHLVEAGPGRGTLMADLLRVCRRVDAGFRQAVQVHFIETSPRLRALQAAACPGASWHGDFGSLPPGPFILLGNEFLDALPIRQFVRRGDGWTERHVQAGVFIEQAVPADRARGLVPERPDVAEGSILELNEASRAFVASVARRVAQDGAAALFVDYGPMRSTAGDSLQAISGGKMTHPLQEPGTADLTAHVDFADLAQVAEANGAQAQGPVTQGSFLTGWGLMLRTAMLAQSAPAKAPQLQKAVARLIDPDQMGALFKVLAIVPRGWPDMTTGGASG